MAGRKMSFARASLIFAWVTALVAVEVFLLTRLLDVFDNDTARGAQVEENGTGGTETSFTTSAAATTIPSITNVSTTAPSGLGTGTRAASDTSIASGTASGPTSAPVTSDAPTTSAGSAPSTSVAPPSDQSAAASGTVAPTAAGPAAPYATLPDGTPVPVIAVFDRESVTIAGAVPSEAAKTTLGDLAVANSKFPDARIENLLTINPAVPASVGVRVIELNSARFPSGTADILPEHAAELDRVARVMAALPHVTALIIGHSDQVGDEATNFALSEARARSVVTYLVGQGISPSRLASRGVGELDLLSINDDATSLALNRRTEFIFYGLIVGT